MIIVIAHLVVAPESVNDLRRAAEQVVPASLGEARCHAYSVSETLNAPGEITFVEEWEDMEALQAHFQEPHFLAFDEILQPLLRGDPEVRVHAVAHSQQL